MLRRHFRDVMMNGRDAGKIEMLCRFLTVIRRSVISRRLRHRNHLIRCIMAVGLHGNHV